MKNIHILPTDKPSRLWVNNLKRRLELEENDLIGSNTAKQHMYITSDEEIEKENYVLALDTNIVFKVSESDLLGIKKFPDIYKKIILTTDSELIKNNVQSIDDEFLEWFIKNPSYKEVSVEKVKDPTDGAWIKTDGRPTTSNVNYQINKIKAHE